MFKNLSLIFLLILLAIFSHAQVGIGTNSPVSSAKLDVSATDKGVMLTRVSLTATNSTTPITGSVQAGLLVYNTATSGSGSTAVTPGFYYYSGTEWVRLITPSDNVAGITGPITLTEGSNIPSASNIDNYPLGQYSFFKLTGTIASFLSGFSGGVSGRQILIVNSTDINQTFQQESVNSITSNRFLLGVSNKTIGINGSATFLYVTGLTVGGLSNQSRWVLIAAQ